jgi:ATP-dependent exoDNAse (exonuclease V) alpha subunit
VVLDEAGMTTDVDMSRLLFAVERARAKIVIVGDHRQLASVGPGGAVAAVVERRPEIVSELRENQRQRDPAERHALAQLRDGHVLPAVGHYATRGRIRIAPRRVEALWTMVEGWTADTQAGHDTFMLAWRRSNVADLNRLARAVAQHLGCLGVEELVAPGGKTYAVGDPVVLLAPNPQGELVTSQRGTVVSIDHDAQALTLAVDDGRDVTLRGTDIDAEHLDYGYAMTVHRQQGATCDRAHYLADGGGRELAYVAMSRARQHSIVHAVADELDEAIDDIIHDWSRDRSQHWITRTASVGEDPSTRPVAKHERPEVAKALAQLDRLRQQTPEPPSIDNGMSL